MRRSHYYFLSLFVIAQSGGWVSGAGLDLLEKYPTQLTAGDQRPEHARAWEFTTNDIFRVAGFALSVGKEFNLTTGPADVGLGHCKDGAVWAVVMPRQVALFTNSAFPKAEAIQHIWLRFHPKEIGRLFPIDGVSPDGNRELAALIQTIARVKMNGSWQAGGQAMIPEPKDLTVDLDTQPGFRRFFIVDTEAGAARYVPGFQNRPVRLPAPITAALAEASFDQLWEAFDRRYAMFVLRPEVDWSEARDEFRPQALAAKSTHEFANICAEMLRPLRDLHVWMQVAGAPVPVFNRPREANANPRARRAILGDLKPAGRSVEWTKTSERIGYVVVHEWNDGMIPRQIDELLEDMRDTRGLIVDVRLNGGGSEPQAERVAGRFLERPFVYAYSQYRNGPRHTNLTEKLERQVAPRGPWRYNRPVVLLIGQKCMSSNESFIAMMSGAPQVTILGDHTCGSSGNPEIVRLPLDVTVSVPKWIDYLPDGTPLDERGFQPQVMFKPASGAFTGERDDLLSAALERLRQSPLPAQPIEGPLPSSVQDNAMSSPAVRPRAALPDYSAEVKEESQDPARPKVVSVSPTNGTPDVDAVTVIRLRFDRPMDPLSIKLDWEAGGFIISEFPVYNAEKHEFTIPMQLAPGCEQRIILNKPFFFGRSLSQARAQFPREGFQSTDQHQAGIFVWGFRTKSVPPPMGATPPGIVAISPPTNSQVPWLTMIEVQFDQAMTPPPLGLPYVISGNRSLEGPGVLTHAQYDAARNLYRIPVAFVPNKPVTFALAGFRNSQGIECAPVKVNYRVSHDTLPKDWTERRAASAKDPKLLSLLAEMKQQREKLTSVSEQVQTLDMRRESAFYTSLRATSASFKWQSPNRFYGDVSGPMLSCLAFCIGSDGTNCWWHHEGQKDKRLVTCPIQDMHQMNLSFCDPFGLIDQTPAAASAKLGLSYAGTVDEAGQKFHLAEVWNVETIGDYRVYAHSIQWRINVQNCRLAELTRFTVDALTRTRFLYESWNQSLPDAAFTMPAQPGLSPSLSEALDENYDRRFLNVQDGSDAQMSVRWGKKGPKGISSSGLN